MQLLLNLQYYRYEFNYPASLSIITPSQNSGSIINRWNPLREFRQNSAGHPNPAKKKQVYAEMNISTPPKKTVSKQRRFISINHQLQQYRNQENFCSSSYLK